MSDEVDWRFRARCRSAPDELFITKGDAADDPPYPPREALRYCDSCVVRIECLGYAMQHNEVGVWGGTTEYQRDQLKRKMNRSSCPGCGGHDRIVAEGQQELCLGCGVSWHVF